MYAKKARNTSEQDRFDSDEVVRQLQDVWIYWTGAGSSNDNLRHAMATAPVQMEGTKKAARKQGKEI